MALEELGVLGVRVAIDDFGTGYSALGYLSVLAVDILKIDKSFIDPVLDGRPSSLLETIVNLGNNLQLMCVAEGIEHPVQAKVLRDLGCRFGQGFLYSRAVPAAEIPKVVGELAPIGSRRPKVTAALP